MVVLFKEIFSFKEDFIFPNNIFVLMLISLDGSLLFVVFLILFSFDKTFSDDGCLFCLACFTVFGCGFD